MLRKSCSASWACLKMPLGQCWQEIKETLKYSLIYYKSGLSLFVVCRLVNMAVRRWRL